MIGKPSVSAKALTEFQSVPFTDRVDLRLAAFTASCCTCLSPGWFSGSPAVLLIRNNYLVKDCFAIPFHLTPRDLCPQTKCYIISHSLSPSTPLAIGRLPRSCRCCAKTSASITPVSKPQNTAAIGKHAALCRRTSRVSATVACSSTWSPGVNWWFIRRKMAINLEKTERNPIEKGS